MKNYINLLKNNPSFTYLWSAQVVSLLGDWFNTIVLSTLVATYSNGSGLAIGLFLMARFLPPMIVSPFAGVLVDRFNRKLILIYCNISRTGIVLLFLLVTSPDRLWLIYFLTIVQFTLSALFEPSQLAIMPSIVRSKDLVLAHTLSGITWSSMLAIGAIIGGGVAVIFGTNTALIFDAATFAVAALLIAQIKPNRHQNTISSNETDEAEDGSFLEGLRYLRANPNIAITILLKGSFSIGNVDMLMTIYATQVFILGTGGELSLSFMYSAFGLGAVCGPLILNKFHDGSTLGLRRMITIAFIWAVIGWLIMGWAPSLLILCVALIIRAMGGSANWTYSSVIIQKTVPDKYLGRMSSLDLAFFHFATVISTLTHGLLIDIFNKSVSLSLLNIHKDTLFNKINLITTPLIAHNLSIIIYATAIISIIPLVIWMMALPKMQKREAVQ